MILLKELVPLVEKFACTPWRRVNDSWLDSWVLLKVAIHKARKDMDYMQRYLDDTNLEIKQAKAFNAGEGPLPSRYAVSVE